MSHIEFVQRCKTLHPTISIIGRYRGADARIAAKCDVCGREWSPYASMLSQKFGCLACSQKRRGQTLKANPDYQRHVASRTRSIVATHVDTGQQMLLTGKKEITAAGFISGCVYSIASGARPGKLHKNFTFAYRDVEDQKSSTVISPLRIAPPTSR